MLSLDRAGVVVAPPASFRVGSVPECYEFFLQRARNPALVTSPLNLQDVTSFTKHRSTDIPRIQQFSLHTKGERKLFFLLSFFFFWLVIIFKSDLKKRLANKDTIAVLNFAKAVTLNFLQLLSLLFSVVHSRK